MICGHRFLFASPVEGVCVWVTCMCSVVSSGKEVSVVSLDSGSFRLSVIMRDLVVGWMRLAKYNKMYSIYNNTEQLLSP